jgi:hypothetical protein
VHCLVSLLFSFLPSASVFLLPFLVFFVVLLSKKLQCSIDVNKNDGGLALLRLVDGLERHGIIVRSRNDTDGFTLELSVAEVGSTVLTVGGCSTTSIEDCLHRNQNRWLHLGRGLWLHHGRCRTRRLQCVRNWWLHLGRGLWLHHGRCRTRRLQCVRNWWLHLGPGLWLHEI